MGGIVLDTSAVIAMMWNEPAGPALRARLSVATRREMSASSYVEAATVLMGRAPANPERALDLLRRFLEDAEIALAPFDVEQAGAAASASLRFGKGRHRARLNLGDCFAYALAKTRKAPLLFVGDDFTHTDLEPALA